MCRSDKVQMPNGLCLLPPLTYAFSLLQEGAQAFPINFGAKTYFLKGRGVNVQK